MIRAAATAIAVLALAAWGCGPSRVGTYPSYDRIVAQYLPAGKYAGAPIENWPTPDGRACDCPRLWYDGHWVYYYHGRWIYWHDDLWWYYPYFLVYYYNGVPYVYTAHGPRYSIEKSSGGGSSSEAAVHRASPPLDRAQPEFHRTRSPRVRSPSPAVRKSSSEPRKPEPRSEPRRKR
jgi:hypothetical protein